MISRSFFCGLIFFSGQLLAMHKAIISSDRKKDKQIIQHVEFNRKLNNKIILELLKAKAKAE